MKSKYGFTYINPDDYVKSLKEDLDLNRRYLIAKEECTKIDKMVSEKVITKDQGDKLKAAVKENLESCK